MIHKLLLIPAGVVTSTTFSDLGLTSLIKKEPLKVRPGLWNDEYGITHYGIRLELNLKQLSFIQSVMKKIGKCNLLPCKKSTTDQEILLKVGMVVNQSA